MGIGKNIPPRSDKGYSGKWEGQYTYGNGYGSRLKGTSSPFTIVIQVDGSGRVTCECLDEQYAAQINAKVVIEGFLLNGLIEFVKRYRYYYQILTDGTIVEKKDRGVHEVHYAGAYGSGIFTGEWKIFSSYVREDGSIGERVSGGYWIMHRAE